MKKAVLFMGCFVMTYFILQIGMGMISTIFYVPDIYDAWNSVGGLSSEVTLGTSTVAVVPFFICMILSLLIAFGVTKLFSKKQSTN